MVKYYFIYILRWIIIHLLCKEMDSWVHRIAPAMCVIFMKYLCIMVNQLGVDLVATYFVLVMFRRGIDE